MSKFDEQIRLGGELSALRKHKEEIAKIREKLPSHMTRNYGLLAELYPLLTKEEEDAVETSCRGIMVVFEGALGRRFNELKEEFEKL